MALETGFHLKENVFMFWIEITSDSWIQYRMFSNPINTQSLKSSSLNCRSQIFFLITKDQQILKRHGRT